MRADVEAIIRAVSEWAGVTAEPHRFGGIEFRLGNVEIGHVHGNGLVDIPFTRKIRERLMADGEAKPHHVLPESGWISFYSRSEADVEQALRLFRLSYLHKSRRTHPDESAFAEALDGLQFGDAIRDLLVVRPAEDEATDDGT